MSTAPPPVEELNDGVLQTETLQLVLQARARARAIVARARVARARAARPIAASTRDMLASQPTETLEVIVAFSGLSGALSLAATSRRLRTMVSAPTLLRALLRRPGPGQAGQAGRAGAFLGNLGEEGLVGELLRTILEQNPQAGKGTREGIDVLLPGEAAPRPVSPAGFILLARAEEAAGGGPRFRVVRVTVGEQWEFGPLAGTLLRALCSTIGRQQEEVEHLWADLVVTTSQEEVVALVRMMGKCSSWLFEQLDLQGEVGAEGWAGLAGQAKRCYPATQGGIESFLVCKEGIAGANKEHLRKVFNVSGQWRIDVERWVNAPNHFYLEEILDRHV